MGGEDDITDDRLLDGRVLLRQPRRGYRVAIDPVLLAAAVPARAGDRILDVGCGTGAVFLCLAARVPNLHITAIDHSPDLIGLARENAAANGLTVHFHDADILAPPAHLTDGRFDHVVTNPPFWTDGAARRKGTVTAAAAHQMPGKTLEPWLMFCLDRLAPRGQLSMILPPARLREAQAILAGAGLSPGIFTIRSKAGGPTKRVILRAGPASSAQDSGSSAQDSGSGTLIMHKADGAYTDAAQRILRQAGALAMSVGPS